MHIYMCTEINGWQQMEIQFHQYVIKKKKKGDLETTLRSGHMEDEMLESRSEK